MGSGISIPTLNINTPGLRLSIAQNATSYVKLEIRSSDTAKLRRADADVRICVDVHVKVLEGQVHGTYMAVKNTSSIDSHHFTKANQSINQPANQVAPQTMPSGHGPLSSILPPTILPTPSTSHPDASVESNHQSFLSSHHTAPLPNGDVHLRLLARHTSNFMPASYFLSIVSGPAQCTVDVTAVISTLPLNGQHQHSSVVRMGEVAYVTRPHATEQRPAILHDDEYIEMLQWRIVDLERELGQASCQPLQTHQALRMQKENARLTLALDDLNRELQSLKQSGVGVKMGSEYVTQLEAINQSSKQTIRELTVRLEEAREHLANKRDRISQLDSQTITQAMKIRELEGRLDQYRHEKNQLIQTAPIRYDQSSRQPNNQSSNQSYHDPYEQPHKQTSNQSKFARSYDVPLSHDEPFRPKTAPDHSVGESYEQSNGHTYNQSHKSYDRDQPNRFEQLKRFDRDSRDKQPHHRSDHDDVPLDQTVKVERQRLGRSISPPPRSNQSKHKPKDKADAHQKRKASTDQSSDSSSSSDDERESNKESTRPSFSEDRKRESPRTNDQSIKQHAKQTVNPSKDESFVVHHARDRSESPKRPNSQSIKQSNDQSTRSSDKYSIHVNHSPPSKKKSPLIKQSSIASPHSHKPVGSFHSTLRLRSRSRSRSPSPKRSNNQSTNQSAKQLKDRKSHSRSPSPKRSNSRNETRPLDRPSSQTSIHRRSSRSPERKNDDRKDQSSKQTDKQSNHLSRGRSRSRSPPSVKRDLSIKASTTQSKRSDSPPSVKRSPSINQSNKRAQSPPSLKRNASNNQSKRSDSPPSRKGSDSARKSSTFRQSNNQSSPKKLTPLGSTDRPSLSRSSSSNNDKQSIKQSNNQDKDKDSGRLNRADEKDDRLQRKPSSTNMKRIIEV